MASFKKLSKSDVTFVPYYANKQWNLSYCPYPTSSEYLTIYNGTNLTGSFSSDEPITEGQYDRLVYSQINQLFYQKYTTSLNTSSLVNSIYYESASQQRPTQSYFIYNDSARLIENFPTSAMEGIRVLAVNQDIYGDKVLPNHFQLSSSAYNIIDDGYGNLYDGVVTGSQQSTNEAYASSGVRLYSSGYAIDGTGTNIEWNTTYIGGSYTGTFWTNPTVANKTGRLNYAGLWSGRSVFYLGTGTLTFNITASSNTTYYFGIGCDNLASLYLDNTLIVAQSYPNDTGDNYEYWHIYPVSVSSGSHVVKLVGENAGIPSPGNPGSMGIEIYNNTSTQISASVAASPNGTSIPAGIDLVYSSKDHLTEGNFDNQYATHVGNLFYAHGLGIITNQDYQYMFPLPPIAKNDYRNFLTTDTKIISASANDYARSGTLNTSSLAFSGSTSGPGFSWATGSNGTIVLTTTMAGTYSVYYTIGANIAGSCAVQLRSNKAKVTAVITEPTTTTTSTTTSTTTAPTTTTTTSTTTSTTTAPTTTTTTTSTTTSTTTAPTTTTSTTTSTTTAPTTTTSTTTSTTTAPTTTTSTTTSTTTAIQTFNVQWRVSGSAGGTLVIRDVNEVTKVNQNSANSSGLGFSGSFTSLDSEGPYSVTASINAGSPTLRYRICNISTNSEYIYSGDITTANAPYSSSVNPTPVSSSVFLTVGSDNTPDACPVA
jgi:hypothetical protein